MSNWRYHISKLIPMYFTSRFENHNGRHWWVWWFQWRGHLLWNGGHREACCVSGQHFKEPS